jgi:hypothetical protein
MPATVAPRRTPRDSAHFGSVAYHAAKELNLTPASAQQAFYHVADRCAAFIRSAMQVGKPEVAERLYAKVESAMCATSAPDTREGLLDLIRRTQEADMLEDIAEAAFTATFSDADRRKWISAIDVQSAMHRQLRFALDAMGRN